MFGAGSQPVIVGEVPSDLPGPSGSGRLVRAARRAVVNLAESSSSSASSAGSVSGMFWRFLVERVWQLQGSFAHLRRGDVLC